MDLFRGRYRFYWLILAFCILTLFFFYKVPQFEKAGPELLKNGDFSQGVEGWELDGSISFVEIDQASLVIDHGNQRHSTTLLQCWLVQALPRQLILSAESSSHNLKMGDAFWHLGRIDLVGYDAHGEGIYRNTRLISMQGEKDWVFTERDFDLPASAVRRCVEISLYSASGQFHVRQLSLKRAEPVAAYKWGRTILLTAWFLLGLRFVGDLFKYYRWRVQGRYLLFLLPLLMGGILMPNDIRMTIENQIFSFWAYLGFQPIDTTLHGDTGVWDLWPKHWDLSKISHLLGFMLLSLVLLSEKERDQGFLIFGLLLLALTTECLQCFVPERTPRLSDIMVDSLGILLGWLLLLTVWGVRQKS
jgi:VanZ family protein